MIRVVYVLSRVNKAVAFEWIEEKLKQEYDLYFILLNSGNSELEKYLLRHGTKVKTLKFSSKRDYPGLFIKLLCLLIKIKPHIVHTHLFDANFLGLFTAFVLRIPRRIYTRHSSTFHHQYYPEAVKWDRFINWLATDIVAISENVKQVLVDKENVNAAKISLIHHGFKLDEFRNVAAYRITALREKYSIAENKLVVGVISRYLHLKGFQYIIPAFRNVLDKNPGILLIIANAIGPDSGMIKKLLEDQLPEGSYIEIKFESDLFALYHLFDVFVHVPINREVEAFGQIYVEALAAGIPSVFTLSGVAPEFIEDKKNALIVPFKDANAIADAIHHILSDISLGDFLIKGGYDSLDMFSLQRHISKLMKLYDK